MSDVFPAVRLVPKARPNKLFRQFAENFAITLERKSLFTPADRFFTLGSCFAREIRYYLQANGVICEPDLTSIAVDPTRICIDMLPNEQHMNFYNTYSIRQQLEKITGSWQQDPDDFWTITRFKKTVLKWEEMPSYQDPYLRTVVARTVPELQYAVQAVDQAMKTGFEKATAFLFTFGMTEVFVNRRSGKIVNQKPGYAHTDGDEGKVDRLFSSFDQNLDNLREIVSIIQNCKPDCPIVMTVSPVALAATFGDTDIYTINTESKAILRAAIGQISREFDNVIYFPAYEMVTALDPAVAYRPDRRHVLTPVVEHIVGAFKEAYFVQSPQDALTPVVAVDGDISVG